jgi:methionyl-tRNA synthetase
MGSAYPTIAADVISRYQKLLGKDVVFVTGSDEQGEKIATTAAGADKAPQDFVDAIVDQFKDLWGKMDIKYDSFIRTTDPKHEAIVRQFFQRVWDKGDIYKKDYSGHYCVGCEAYLGDDEMETVDGVEHVCKIHRKPAELRREENYFFRLSKYQQALEKLFLDRPDFVQPSYRFNEVKKWVEAGVPDFSISRSTISWGIPVPNDPEQVIYVWFDALLLVSEALN